MATWSQRGSPQERGDFVEPVEHRQQPIAPQQLLGDGASGQHPLRGMGVRRDEPPISRTAGVERTVRLERDARILVQALDPCAMPQWVLETNAKFGDPAKTRLYLACDQAVDWDPYDPCVDRLIDELDAWQIEHEGGLSGQSGLRLVDSLVAEASPAWQRVLDVLTHRVQRRRTAASSS